MYRVPRMWSIVCTILYYTIQYEYRHKGHLPAPQTPSRSPRTFGGRKLLPLRAPAELLACVKAPRPLCLTRPGYGVSSNEHELWVMHQGGVPRSTLRVFVIVRKVEVLVSAVYDWHLSQPRILCEYNFYGSLWRQSHFNWTHTPIEPLLPKGIARILSRQTEFWMWIICCWRQ